MTKSQKAVSVFVGLVTGIALTGAAAVLPLVASAETYNFTATLKLGSKGTEVMNLQKVLNSDPNTMVAASGVGSSGMESTYFGAKTKAAVVKYQTAKGISPKSGTVGPLTRAALNAQFGSGTTGTTGGGTTVPGTNLVVALAADTPLSGALIQGQAVADLAHFTITNKSSVDAKVTSFVFKRTGISNDATLVNVYLYNGATRLTDSAAVSQTMVTFNDLGGIVTVPAGGSVTVAVKADIAGGTAGQLIGVELDMVTSNVAVSSILPIGGHIQSIAAATLAGVNFAATVTPTGTPAVDPQDGYVMWQNSVDVTTRAVDMKTFALRQIGSVSTSDLRNFKLYVDGTQVGATVASMDANGYVTFDLTASPVRLQTGTRIVKMLGDIVGGSTRTFSFSLQQPGDAMMVDSELGQPVLATANSTTFSARTTGTNTVNAGTLTITKATDSPSGNVTPNASGVTLGRFQFKAAGEPIKVENLRAYANVSTAGVGSLRNGAIFANGVQVGSTAALTDSSDGSAYTTYNLGSSLVVYPGTPVVVEIKGDIYDGDGTPATIANGDTITAAFAAGSSNLKKMSSLNYTSNTAVAANQLTVAVGALSMSKNQAYGNQTTVAPRTAYKMAAFNLVGGSSEGVNLDTITVNFAGSTSPATTALAGQLTDVYVKYGTKTTTIKPTIAVGDNSFSINELLAANQSMPIEVYATMSSTLGNTDTATTTVTVSGTTAASSLAKTTGAVVGQTITVANGSVASSFVSDSAYNTKLVVGGTEQKVASYKFTATNDSFTVTDIAVNFAGANAASAINYVVLKNSSGTVLNVGGTPLNGTEATSSGLAIAVPANGDASVDVYVNLNTVGAGAATTTADVKATLDTFKYQASTGVQGTDANDRNANDIYVVRTLPTIANVSLPSTTLAAGTQTISRVKISADAAAPISWKKLTFTVAKQNATLGSTSTMQLTDSANNVIAGTFATTSGDATITFVATTEQSIGSSETYNLKVSVGGIIAGYNYITTNIAAPSSTVATPNTYATIAGGTGSFIWSDKSALSHSESTADWLNDFKVLGLPTDSQTMAVSI